MSHPEIRINKRDGQFVIELIAVRCNSEESLEQRTAELHELGEQVQELADVIGWTRPKVSHSS